MSDNIMVNTIDTSRHNRKKYQSNEDIYGHNLQNSNINITIRSIDDKCGDCPHPFHLAKGGWWFHKVNHQLVYLEMESLAWPRGKVLQGQASKKTYLEGPSQDGRIRG